MTVLSISIDKANHTYSIDFDALPEASRARVISYGLTQILSDAAAPVSVSASIDGRRIPLQGSDLTKAQTAAKALVDRRLEGLVSGLSRTVRTGGSSDPVSVAAKRIAIGQVKRSHLYQSWMATGGHKLSDKVAIDKLNELANAQAKLEPVLALARQQVAMESAIGDELSVDGHLKPSAEPAGKQAATAKPKASKAA